MYVFYDENEFDETSDEEIMQLRNQTFVKFEEKRKKKNSTNEIIKIRELPFGLWQCQSCGFVNKIINWPDCIKCKI